MKNKKLQLKILEVSSSITTLNTDETDAIKGGQLVKPANNNGMVTPSLGRKLMWTVTEQRKDAVGLEGKHFGKHENGEKP